MYNNYCTYILNKNERKKKSLVGQTKLFNIF